MFGTRCPLVLLVSLVAFFCVTLSPLAQAQNTFRTRGIHHAKDVQCKDCHLVDKPTDAPAFKVCVDCHGPYEKIAKRTEKVEINPHDSHLGPIDCLSCHGTHEVKEMKEVPCLECHTEFTFKMK